MVDLHLNFGTFRCRVGGSVHPIAYSALRGGLQDPLVAADDRQERPVSFAVPAAGERFDGLV